jgi:excisionase family DNA binding protein
MTESRVLLTTGQAAELLCVTRDTILKWIKKGRLPATKTAGGHHRVNRKDLQPLLGEAASEGQQPTPLRPAHCWEYYAEDGEVSASCAGCLVYRARAARCHELSRLPPELGFAGTHCTTRCEDCSYYQATFDTPRKVLVVSSNGGLRERLVEEGRGWPSLELEFATCGYECASVLDSFRPTSVIVDEALPGEPAGKILTHLASDPRIPDVWFFLVGDSGNVEPSPAVDVRRIPRTFALQQLEGMIRNNEVMRAAGSTAATAG